MNTIEMLEKKLQEIQDADGGGVMSKVLLPVTESITGDISALASAIHYPECWDTAAYPDLMSALLEVATWAGCSVCEPGYMRDREVIELRRQLELVTRALEELSADIDGLVEESYGVSGLHLNGDVAPWDELLPGGRFERLSGLLTASEALAAVREPAASPWQLIETAPKDGTEVLLTCASGDIGVCYWRNDEVLNDWTWGLGKRFKQPTHWMPLPTLPSSPAGEGEQS